MRATKYTINNKQSLESLWKWKDGENRGSPKEEKKIIENEVKQTEKEEKIIK